MSLHELDELDRLDERLASFERRVDTRLAEWEARIVGRLEVMIEQRHAEALKWALTFSVGAALTMAVAFAAIVSLP
jgi:hypothetical protein